MSTEEVLATLRKAEEKAHKAPKGDVTTVKMLLRTAVGWNDDLLRRLDDFVLCTSLMHRRPLSSWNSYVTGRWAKQALIQCTRLRT
ncbi:hypothetical protein DUNSADRAFT_1430 [Dunaliella salina]|uniref:Uncharacterized protein n=1 Tax=Dunaliella salina TaxID=3046 RepID=A0ABQ7FXH7_DUNSA|nr:hypothetical protein DUNSADRAFT_1430 [Dunaliella salina]|eukprot:KAF5827055.1 hypothetical protein DUNSADRAFT_1430 [Dunaliella salina]